MKHKTLTALVVCLIAATFVAPAVGQDPAYHVMADQRTLFGIPNALNVLSNIPFLIVGVLGIVAVERGGARPFRRAPYLLFFTGSVLTAFGSAWYHLAPSNAGLVWDRLPMTIAFTGLLTAVLAERVSERIARDVFAPLVAAGALSVLYWYVTESGGRGDLRPYALIQFGSLAVMLVVLVLYRSKEAGAAFLWAGLGCYAAAKVLEFADAPVYQVVPVSGHTLKHLFAAAGVGAVALMLGRRRRTVGPSRSSLRRRNSSVRCTRSSARSSRSGVRPRIGLVREINYTGSMSNGTGKTINSTGRTINSTGRTINDTDRTINGTDRTINDTDLRNSYTGTRENGAGTTISGSGARTNYTQLL